MQHAEARKHLFRPQAQGRGLARVTLLASFAHHHQLVRRSARRGEQLERGRFGVSDPALELGTSKISQPEKFRESGALTIQVVLRTENMW